MPNYIFFRKDMKVKNIKHTNNFNRTYRSKYIEETPFTDDVKSRKIFVFLLNNFRSLTS